MLAMDETLSSAAQSPAETRRAQILEAAAAVFAEKGYQRATVREIATRAGVAPGTIYLYFKNKCDLLLVIADQLIGQAWDQTQAQMARVDPEAYIAAVLKNMLHFTRQNRSFLRALSTEIWTDNELQRQFFTQIIGPLFEAAARYLQAHIKEGRVRPCQVEIVTPTIAGSLIVLSIMRALATEDFLADFSEDELVDELTRLYLRGLRPDR
jgi:TetR/AcrR family transcriptional regulator